MNTGRLFANLSKKGRYIEGMPKRELDFKDALDLARSYVKQKAAECGIDLQLVEAEILEKSFGWVFFYQSKRFLETGDYSERLAGNAPFIIDRRDGGLHTMGTAKPLEDYLAGYEALRN